ncbi:MAG: GNAT family N-acetyltransferase [Chloroflexi bacterium]|nr:GNAT family N-acetyltransferase [Chloroflexota bacterium]
MDIAAGHLFMQARAYVPEAAGRLPAGFAFGGLERREFYTWATMHFDASNQHAYLPMMLRYYAQVYAPWEDEFFRQVRTVRQDGRIIASCFKWRAYRAVTTVHWFRVLPAFEGRGIGRALLGEVLGALKPQEWPVYLHTHPASYRAIKLYTDFGFRLIEDERIGTRSNSLRAALPWLRARMPEGVFASLRSEPADAALVAAAASREVSEF